VEQTEQQPAPAKVEDLSAKTTAELTGDICSIIKNRYRKEIIPPHAEKCAGYNQLSSIRAEHPISRFVFAINKAVCDEISMRSGLCTS